MFGIGRLENRIINLQCDLADQFHALNVSLTGFVEANKALNEKIKKQEKTINDMSKEIDNLRKENKKILDAIDALSLDLENASNASLKTGCYDESFIYLKTGIDELEKKISKLEKNEKKQVKSIAEKTMKEDTVSYNQIINEWLNGEEKANE